MPTWNLRLVACAGFVALLSRLPALDSAADALLLGAAAGALALVVRLAPAARRALREHPLLARLRLTHPHPALSPRFRPAHGADA